MPGAMNSEQAIVLDTSAFIAGSESLYTLGGLTDSDGNALSGGESGSVKFYTTRDVISEVKDANARRRLKLIEHAITLRVPSKEAMASVVEFARHSGDYANLSLTDLKVVALAWMLEHEKNGMTYLNEPKDMPDFSKPRGIPSSVLDEIEQRQRQEEETNTNINKVDDDGWCTVTKNVRPISKVAQKKLKRKESKKRKKERLRQQQTEDAAMEEENEQNEEAGSISIGDLSGTDVLGNQETSAAAPAPVENGGATEECVDEDPDDGWITAENLDVRIAADSGLEDAHQSERLRVGCVTTDYSMQNVLVQLGLKVLSTDGRRVIRKIKRYILRCHACYQLERDVTKKFCAKCGNAAFHKVAYKVDANGVARVFVNPKFRASTRGTVYSIPLPKGGRNNKDLILREDQVDHIKLRRLQKQRSRLNVDVLDPGGFYNAGARFNPQHDLTVVGYGRRNPNANRSGGNKKK